MISQGKELPATGRISRSNLGVAASESGCLERDDVECGELPRRFFFFFFAIAVQARWPVISRW